MRTIWYSLVWKEWHEHKWKLAAITVILWWIVALVATFTDPRDRLGLAAGLVTISMIPLAIFIGLGTAASEASRRTLPYLQALPAPLGHVAVVKLFFGLLTVVAPVLLAVCAIYGWSLFPAPFGPLRTELNQLNFR